VISGEHGDMRYVCGGCRAALIEGMNAGQVSNIVIRCPACGVYNETLD
jgi:DNA-directed RNA polymerase subunit RPC12/RpoP